MITKEEIQKRLNEQVEEINKLNEERLKLFGKLELLLDIEKEKVENAKLEQPAV